jgi:apolipoprotein N-acyltransferase
VGSDRRGRSRLGIAALGSAAAMYLSSGDPLLPWLAWIAPAPILALAFEKRSRLKPASTSDTTAQSRLKPASTPDTPASTSDTSLALAAFVAGFAGNLAWVVLYRGILPVVPLLGFALLFGAAFAAAAWLTAWVTERRGPWAGVVSFPSFWVAFELGVARWSPHGTAGSLAYSQVDFVLLIQVAAWTGLAGITFLVQFVAAGVASAVGAVDAGGSRWRFAAIPTGLLAVVTIFGAWRVQATTHDVHVAVGLAARDQAMARFDTTSRDEAMPVAAAYLDAVRTLAGRQVEAIVMPEKMVGLAPAYEQEVSNLFAAAAEEHQVLLVAGLNLVGRAQARNVAAVFSRGRKALEYDKQHLVPGFERMYTPGSSPALYKAPGGMTGIAICKDMDFAQLGREYSRAGVGLLFVPAWDFTRDGWLHSRMALMRGVEGGYSVARAAASGLLTASDPLGRVVAERGSDEAPTSMLLAILPLGRGGTFYGEHGDWFAWGSVLAAAALLALAATRTR